MSGSCNVLILGGCGFVGRNLVKFLVERNLCAYIRVADKAMPATSNMTPEQEQLYSAPNVEYKQCNLTNPGTDDAVFLMSSQPGVMILTVSLHVASITKVFTEDKGPWNFVINLASEAKYGQPEAVRSTGPIVGWNLTFLVFVTYAELQGACAGSGRALCTGGCQAQDRCVRGLFHCAGVRAWQGSA
jgi:hypothetical protein